MFHSSPTHSSASQHACIRRHPVSLVAAGATAIPTRLLYLDFAGKMQHISSNIKTMFPYKNEIEVSIRCGPCGHTHRSKHPPERRTLSPWLMFRFTCAARPDRPEQGSQSTRKDSRGHPQYACFVARRTASATGSMATEAWRAANSTAWRC